MNKLSVAIITKNEERNIGRCLKSVQWADEIVVVDSGSSDKTIDICQKFNCKIVETEWLGFGKTKQLAVNNCSHDWVLSIDADEELTTELQNRIKTILQNPDAEGYYIKRMSFYLNKLIQHCGWNHDFPLRLFNRRNGSFNEKIVHEAIEVNGTVKKIKEVMFHYTYPTISFHIQKIDFYSTLGAERISDKRSSISKAVMRGLFKFIKMYIIQLGFLDGKIGFVLSVNSAYGVYLKYIKLWETNQ
ncbi:MAG: glycosyltransferase family 2 protein [Candidatus Cloacimonetes bacterium]|nr:glycosyltransferase family 2 protein [Candidatus Cloacimonadota bacterium]